MTIEELYKLRYKSAIKVMYSITKNHHTAEDITQEAFTRAIKFFPSFDSSRGCITKWFNGILFNTLRDVQKDERNKGTVGNEVEDFSHQDLLGDTFFQEFPERRVYLIQLISAQENPMHRQVLERFFILGYTSTEIAKMELEVTANNVAAIVKRFKDNILDQK